MKWIKGFLIPPFALLFVYLIFAHAFNLPKFGSLLFESGFVSWIGVAVCIVGLIIFLMSLIAFGFILIGILLDLPELDISDLPCSWVSAVLPSGTALEKRSLKKHYGEEYTEYCKKVRRFF